MENYSSNLLVGSVVSVEKLDEGRSVITVSCSYDVHKSNLDVVAYDGLGNDLVEGDCVAVFGSVNSKNTNVRQDENGKLRSKLCVFVRAHQITKLDKAPKTWRINNSKVQMVGRVCCLRSGKQLSETRVVNEIIIGVSIEGESHYIPCVMYRPVPSFVEEGKVVYVEGPLIRRKYMKSDQTDDYTVEIIVNKIKEVE